MKRKINVWKNRKGKMLESAWVQQGITLFQELLINDSNNTEYKVELAKLLMTKGKDKKLYDINLHEAERLFHEVLQLDPHYPEVHYRLGHVYFEQKNYEKAIEYFKQALEKGLSSIQLFRTYEAMAASYYYLECFSKAKFYFHKAEKADRERNFTSELMALKKLITEDGQVKALLHDSDGVSIPLTRGQAERVITDDENELKLDLTNIQYSLLGPDDAVTISKIEAKVLKYLYENRNRYINKRELMDKVWGKEVSAGTVKGNISRIRNKLKKCLPDEIGEIIATKWGEGYRWVAPPITKIQERNL